LLAAVASYLEARKHDGQWLLRIEDIDPPREQPGATEEILAALERYGFAWDGPVTYQSESHAHHREAVQELIESGMAYRCGCSRRDLAAARRCSLGIVYPGTCRNGSDAQEAALRVRTDDVPLTFDDYLQGSQVHRLESESGDFIILRRDKLIAYQIAVVVDDHLQGITDVVRGIDLMDSTPRQIWLQHLLGYAQPNYCHIPVAINDQGQKLSKSHGSKGVSLEHAERELHRALVALQQHPPGDLETATIPEIWEWAAQNWNIDGLKNVDQIATTRT
jgi:glutamyl-Q tRNA(Asp) synthetase